jgi:hypothetical protein
MLFVKINKIKKETRKDEIRKIEYKKKILKKEK